MRVLAFGPHPDDIEFYCAGTLAKYKAQGHEVGFAVMTRGDIGSPSLTREEISSLRESEARRSAEILGAEFFWLGYDDEFLYDSPDVRRAVIDVIRQFRPDIVLCPDKDNDYHPDHVRTGQIVWDTHVMATVPLIKTAHSVTNTIHAIWCYDTIGMLNFQPEFYVDITDFWDVKQKMLACHDSQNEWMEYVCEMDLIDHALQQNRMRGIQTGCQYAEAFRRLRVYPMSVAKDGLLPD
jgi:LmbE family N-acetylglucosaminyl deacetylase